MPAALRHRDFAIFWYGLVVSGIGSQFSSVASAWQIYELTGSPLQIGLLGLSRAIPQMGLQLFGGVLADALDRRRLMMLTQLTQLCVSASLVALTLAGLISPAILYAANVLAAFSTALENPARQALVPNLVPREELTSALSLNSTQRTLGQIAGPTIAGLVLATGGIAWCYAVDASSWVVMLGALLLINSRQTATRGRRAVSLGALQEGVHFVWSNQILLWFMVLDFAATFFGGPRALMPIYAKEILDVGAQGLGVLYSAASIGALAGALVVNKLPRRDRASRWVLAGVAFYGLCTCAFAVSTNFWVSLLMLAGTGLGNTVSTVLRGTVDQLVTPDELRGRVQAVKGVFTNGGPQLSQFESGVVADLWGVQFSALSGGVATVLV
ncbi:MAG: hypothetical protein QOF51_3605, partial [Chloroflexota bacterium]|nr:hypothetical protein [Chloroflexota bacterium]